MEARDCISTHLGSLSSGVKESRILEKRQQNCPLGENSRGEDAKHSDIIRTPQEPSSRLNVFNIKVKPGSERSSDLV